WMLRRLEADLGALSAETPVELETGDASVLVRADRRGGEDADDGHEPQPQLELFAPAAGTPLPPALELPPLEPVPGPRLAVARLRETGDLRSELPFAFEHDGVLLHGRFDLFRLLDGRALIVDYKTNRLEEHAPEELVEEEYALQRLVYALAAFRAGADEVEVA